MPHMCLARSLPLRVGISAMWVGVIRWPFDVSWLSGFIVREKTTYLVSTYLAQLKDIYVQQWINPYLTYVLLHI